MICPTKPITKRQSKHCVDEILEELGKAEIVVELVESEEDVARWNKLVRKHHYLKEHQLVGESLRYVAKQNDEWVALLGWSSCAFHLRPRDAWIGWTDIQRRARRTLVVCNARFRYSQIQVHSAWVGFPDPELQSTPFEFGLAGALRRSHRTGRDVCRSRAL